MPQKAEPAVVYEVDPDAEPADMAEVLAELLLSIDTKDQTAASVTARVHQ